MGLGKKIGVYFLSVGIVTLGMFAKYAFWPAAEAGTVAGISHDLACPCECPMVLEDCHMSCGLEWKDMVGKKLKAGLTKEEINEYFFKRYGDAAMLTPIQRLHGKWYQLTRKGFPIREGSLMTGMVLVWGGIVYLIIGMVLPKKKGPTASLFIFMLTGLGMLAGTGTVWAENTIPASDMVLIPAGEFLMGSSDSEIRDMVQLHGGKESWFADENPQRKVQIKSFYMDRFEVTDQQYSAFDPSFLYPEDRKDHPIVGVTWQNAADYCKWAGKRLPTEEEWEKAARGTDGRVYPWGNSFDASKANTTESGRGGKARVGSFELETSGALFPGGTVETGKFAAGVSPYGIYDMAGNVWEWTDSWYDSGKTDNGLRVLKGGSWISPSISSRAALRLGDDGPTVANDYGFRCAKDAELP